MNEEMATEIVGNLYDTMKKFELSQKNVSENVQRYVMILKMQMELEKQREQILCELNEFEKEAATHVLKEEITADIPIPEYLTVRDVAQILDVTPQMVRRYCAVERIEARQRMEGSGKWLIPSEQFLTHPNWTKFVHKQEKQKRQSLNIANKMLQYLEEDED